MEKKLIVIDAERECYSPHDFFSRFQKKETLTVGDLLSVLEGLDEDTPVILRHDGGYSYGGFRFDRIHEAVLDPVSEDIDYI